MLQFFFLYNENYATAAFANTLRFAHELALWFMNCTRRGA